MQLLQRIVLDRFIEAADGNRMRFCLTRSIPRELHAVGRDVVRSSYLGKPQFVELVIRPHTRWVCLDFENSEQARNMTGHFTYSRIETSATSFAA